MAQKPELELTYKDFQEIMSMAKSQYATLSFPISIGERKLDYSENANYCLMLAFTMFLNKNEALNKLPTFKKGR